MPIKRPELVNGEIYHIVLRGVGDPLIFKDANDYYRGIFSLYEFNTTRPIEIREQRRKRAIIKASGGQSSVNFSILVKYINGNKLMARVIKNSLGNIYPERGRRVLVILVIFALVAGWFYSGWPQVWKEPPVPPEVQEAHAAGCTDSGGTLIESNTKCRIVLTSGSSFTVPDDWDSNTGAKAELVGGGKGGSRGSGTGDSGVGGAGGAGGGYANTETFTASPNDSISYSIGTGGAGASTAGAAGANGGNTWFRSQTELLAAGGGTGATQYGSTTYAGGAAGSAGGGKGGSGGGGAAGPQGVGKAGGTGATGGGGGGGSAGSLADVGANASGNTAGTGGPGYLGSTDSPGGTAGQPGTKGGGGGGGTGQAGGMTGGAGGTSDNLQSSPAYGTGGGGGGAGGPTGGNISGLVGGNGGLYGGGGGGGGGSTGPGNKITGNGGDGAAGIIVITYTRAVAAEVSISISDGEITYGLMALNATNTTCAENDTQIVQNTGDVTVTLNIRGQNSTNWSLASAAASEEYKHAFSTSTCPLADGVFTALTTNYQTMASGVAPDATTTLNLLIHTPTATEYYTEQSVNVTVQAVGP